MVSIAQLAGAPRFPMTGRLLTLQSVGAQAIALITVVLGSWYNERFAKS